MVIIIVTVGLAADFFPAAKVHAQQRNVKIGVSGVQGFYEKNSQGVMEGYGVDLLGQCRSRLHLWERSRSENIDGGC